MSNFAFLQVYWPDFANTLDFAEKYVYTDPASSKNKSGLFVELMVREIMRIENIPEPEYDNTHFTRTKILKSEGLLPYDVNQWINQVRIKRNDSAHENIASPQDALVVLGFTFSSLFYERGIFYVRKIQRTRLYSRTNLKLYQIK